MDLRGARREKRPPKGHKDAKTTRTQAIRSSPCSCGPWVLEVLYSTRSSRRLCWSVVDDAVHALDPLTMRLPLVLRGVGEGLQSAVISRGSHERRPITLS